MMTFCFVYIVHAVDCYSFLSYCYLQRSFRSNKIKPAIRTIILIVVTLLISAWRERTEPCTGSTEDSVWRPKSFRTLWTSPTSHPALYAPALFINIMLRTNLAKCKIRSSTNTCSECTVCGCTIVRHGALWTVRTVFSQRLYVVHRMWVLC